MPVYPLLAAAYAVLALVAKNLHEAIRLADVWLPLLIALAVALTGWLLAGLATRDPHRRALFSLVLVVCFVGYGVVGRRLEALALQPAEMRDLLGFAILGGVLIAAGVLIVRARRDLASVSRFLNIASAVLLGFPVASIGVAFLHRARAGPDGSWMAADVGGDAEAEEPDIYLIVLDAYTGHRTLATDYGFDNSAFEGFLRRRGFYVPERSHANYVSTFLSLSSALNWEYLDDIPATFGEDSRDRSIGYRRLEDNRTVRYLKDRGYRFVFVRSAYPALSRNRHADLHIPSWQVGEFQRVWASGTAMRPIAAVACLLLRCGARALPFDPETTHQVSRKFELLAEAARLPGPKFVFAHFLVPHEPLIYRADCTPRDDSYWPGRIDRRADRLLRQGYVDQVRCVNRKVSALVDRLLAASPSPPVILLQADHGFGRFPFGQPTRLEEADASQIRDRTEIFAAYHLPGGAASRMYDSITPVNAIRLVLAHYFGADLPPLEDRTYWSAWAIPYRFTRIDGRTSEAVAPGTPELGSLR